MLHKIADILSHDYWGFVGLVAFIAFFVYCGRRNRRQQGNRSATALEGSDSSRMDGQINLMEHRHEDFRSPSDTFSPTALPEVNPATGLMMVGGIGGIDTAGNTYGSNSNS